MCGLTNEYTHMNHPRLETGVLMRLLCSDNSFFYHLAIQHCFLIVHKKRYEQKNSGSSSSIEKNEARKSRVFSSTRTNASGLTEEADKVLVAHLTRENPDTIKLEQVVKSNSQVFSIYTKANNYDKIRNRYNYLKKIRLNEPHVFVSLCIGYKVQIS